MKCLIKIQAFKTIYISLCCSFHKWNDADNYQPLCTSRTCFIHSKTTDSFDNTATVGALRRPSKHTEKLWAEWG